MSVSAKSKDNAVHVTKSVSGDGKTLTLEAYATNTMTTVTTYEPLDIVLVLDVSGSMRYCINCNATYDYYPDFLGGDGEWKWGNGSPYCSGKDPYVYVQKGKAKDLGQSNSPLYTYESSW